MRNLDALAGRLPDIAGRGLGSTTNIGAFNRGLKADLAISESVTSESAENRPPRAEDARNANDSAASRRKCYLFSEFSTISRAAAPKVWVFGDSACRKRYLAVIARHLV